MVKSLTPRQARFVDEYLVDLSTSKAAIRAGYSKKSAPVIGSTLVKKDHVAAAIAVAQKALAERTRISQDKVVEEIARLAFSNMLDYVRLTDDGLATVDLSDLTRDKATAFQEITVEEFADGKRRRIKFKLADKKANLELLCRHLGLFGEKTKAGGVDLAAAIAEARRRLEKIERGRHE